MGKGWRDGEDGDEDGVGLGDLEEREGIECFAVRGLWVGVRIWAGENFGKAGRNGIVSDV